MEQTQSAGDPVPEFIPPPMRVFEISFTNGRANDKQTAQAYSTETGHLIFIDFVADRDKRYRMMHRRTVAAGQWCDVREVGAVPQSEQPSIH